MARLVSLGSALQDIYLVDGDDFIAKPDGKQAIFGKLIVGSKVDIDAISYEVGGGGTNAAVSFARHGHKATFIGNIGDDIAGQAVMDCLKKEGINRRYVSTVKSSTGCSIILLDRRSGERTILTHRGASAKFANLDPNVLSRIRPSWLYVTSLKGDLKTLEKFIKKAKSLNTKIMFNPGELELKQKHELLKILPKIDILLLNKCEASELVPGVLLTELLDRLRNYVQTVIITDGQMGTIASNGEETFRLGLYEDLKVKDTTGAGDAFGSGFLAHFAAGNSFEDSLIFAAANSTFVVAKLGAKTGILTGREKLHQMPIQKI